MLKYFFSQHFLWSLCFSVLVFIIMKLVIGGL